MSAHSSCCRSEYFRGVSHVPHRSYFRDMSPHLFGPAKFERRGSVVPQPHHRVLTAVASVSHHLMADVLIDEQLGIYRENRRPDWLTAEDCQRLRASKRGADRYEAMRL